MSSTASIITFTLLLSTFFARDILTNMFFLSSVTPSPPPNEFKELLTATNYKTTRFDERYSTVLISREVIINKGIDQVFDAVTTPGMWLSCYPETIAVTGNGPNRPMKLNDLILEKFLFSGLIYTQFRYDVEALQRPHHVRFHGIMTMTNAIVDSIIDKSLGGTFNYTFESITPHQTRWQRDLYLYTTSSTWLSQLQYRLMIGLIRPSQERGASLFVECAKILLEKGDE
jgi:hypothetical protein